VQRLARAGVAGRLRRTRAEEDEQRPFLDPQDRIAGPERVGPAVGAALVGPVGHRLLLAPPGAALAATATAPARRPPGSEPSERASPPDTAST
jgi:hypothetical protein